MALMSREDLRQELNAFLVETCGKELQQLGAKVLKDVQQELRSFMDAERMIGTRVATPQVQFNVPSTPPCGITSMTTSMTTGGLGGGLNHAVVVTRDGTGFQVPPEFDQRQMRDAVQKGRSASRTHSHPDSHESGLLQKPKPNDTGLGPESVAPLREAGQARQITSECWVSSDGEAERPTSAGHSVGLPGSVEEVKGGGGDQMVLLEANTTKTPEFQSAGEGSSNKALMIPWQSVKNSLDAPGYYGLKARSVVDSAYFDYVFGTLLILNGVVIGAETNYRARSSELSTPVSFQVLSILFCIGFSTELGLRLLAYRRKLYTMRGWKWSIFDTFIVCVQILDELTTLLFAGSAVQDATSDIGIIRLLRLGRVVRLVRMVRLIPELKSMVYLIFASMSSFIWAMVLIILLMYCVAVFYVDTSDKLVKDQTITVNVDDIQLYWASVERAMLTLFQALTSGNDWHNFIDCFDGAGDFAYVVNALAFSLYVAFGMLVMLNLVTGVFVEGAQRIVKRDKDAELMRTVCKVFGEVDDDESMCLSYPEFMSHLDEGSLDPYFQALDMNKSQAKGLFALLDSDCDQVLSMKEFVFGCMRLRGPARAIDLAAFGTDMQLLVDRLRSDTEQAILQLSLHTKDTASEIRRISSHTKEGTPAVNVHPAAGSVAES